MDQILNQVTSTEFWINVLLGQVLFIGGMIWIVSSVRKDFQKMNEVQQNKNQNQGQGF